MGLKDIAAAAQTGGLSVVGDKLLGEGKKFFSTDSNAGMAAYAAVIEELKKVGIPDIEAQQIVLEAPELVGELIPQLEDKIGPDLTSAFEQVSGEKYEPQQMKALAGLEERAEMGLTPQEEAELNKIRREMQGQAQSRDERVLQNLEERGLLGGGAELAMRQAANQEAAQSAAEMGDRQAAMSFAARMGALEKLGGMAGQMRSQDVAEQQSRAQAQDIFNRYNREQAQALQQRNIDRMNLANAQNLQTRQNLEAERARQANLQEMHNKGLIQQRFQNEIQRAGGVASGYQTMGGAQQQAAAQQAQLKGQLIGGAAQLGGAAIMSDVNAKRNINDGDRSIEEMLDAIDSYDYNYNPEEGIEGRHTGVMAQDLEKSDVGSRFVQNTPDGKMVDYQQAAPAMMAGQANLNKRLRNLERMFMGQDKTDGIGEQESEDVIRPEDIR